MDFEFIAEVAEEERTLRTAALTGWEAVVFELEDEVGCHPESKGDSG
jgi:hypothetical protein